MRIDIDKLIVEADMSGISALVKEFLSPKLDPKTEVEFYTEKRSQQIRLTLSQLHDFYETLVNRSGANNVSGHLSRFRYMTVNAVMFLVDIVINENGDSNKIIEYISDVTVGDKGFRLYPVPYESPDAKVVAERTKQLMGIKNNRFLLSYDRTPKETNSNKLYEEISTKILEGAVGKIIDNTIETTIVFESSKSFGYWEAAFKDAKFKGRLKFVLIEINPETRIITNYKWEVKNKGEQEK